MKQRNINKLVRLGELLSKTEQFNDIFEKAEQQNSWFTRTNVIFAFKSWSDALSKNNVKQWLSQYQLPQTTSPKRILIVMAGNLPLVGLHDLLCVFYSLVLLSSAFISERMSMFSRFTPMGTP